MTPFELLALAEAKGVRFAIGEGGIRMTAEVPAPPELLVMLRQQRDAILALLDHDAGEAAAMAEHYAAPVAAPGDGVGWYRPQGLEGQDRLVQGLLKGSTSHAILTKPRLRLTGT